MIERRALLAFLAGGALTRAAAGPARAQAQAQTQDGGGILYPLATATRAGNYYRIGTALGLLSQLVLPDRAGLALVVRSSAGSAENVDLVTSGEVAFGMMTGLYAGWAWRGTGPYAERGPQQDFRVVARLWENAEHVIIRREHADTGTIADLDNVRSRPFAIGELGSGAQGSTRSILENLGYSPERDFQLVYMGYDEAREALRVGAIQGMSVPAAAPVSAVTETLGGPDDHAVMLRFDGDQSIRADNGMGVWSPATIPAGTYPGLTEDFPTIAKSNLLCAHVDVPAAAVHAVTALVYDNLDFLRQVLPATASMSADTALLTLSLPLHPGAARYFADAGLIIPPAAQPRAG